jgi:uncharacterized membrane protein (UPF0136 family)
MAAANFILWVYIALLVTGGLIGFFKAKSQASLYTSVGFAAALALCAAGVIKGNLADILLIVLMVFFTLRLAKSKKFMPAGMMLALTILALALRNIHF